MVCMCVCVFFRSKMHLSTLSILLLVSCALMVTGNQASDAYLHNMEGARSATPLGIYGDVRQNKEHRQRRALSGIRFLQAFTNLKSIVKTAFLSTKSSFGTRIYAKVGTHENALADFTSLGPKNVLRAENELHGRVGNQDITLLLHDNGSSVMFINSIRIVYADNIYQAWADMLKIRQKFGS